MEGWEFLGSLEPLLALPPLVLVVVVRVCRTPSWGLRSSVMPTAQPWCGHCGSTTQRLHVEGMPQCWPRTMPRGQHFHGPANPCDGGHVSLSYNLISYLCASLPPATTTPPTTTTTPPATLTTSTATLTTTSVTCQPCTLPTHCAACWVSLSLSS